jgi:hypothetical protein
MKRNWTIALVIALAVAGVLLAGCSPSESEEGKTIEGNIVLKGGKIQYDFTEPKIEDGKTYEVVFNINDCDEGLLGSYLGGKLSYKVGDVESILSGWARPVPSGVSSAVKKYTWTFKAGEANDDDKPIANPATTPDGARQYFDFIAQDSSWQNYGADTNFNVDGSFEVKEVAVITDWVKEAELTLGSGDGKCELSASDAAKIRSFPTGKIVLSVSVMVTSGSSEPGWGVATIGPSWEPDPRNISINVPGDATIGQQCDFDGTVMVSALLVGLGDSQIIIINPFNGASITKAELFRPGP